MFVAIPLPLPPSILSAVPTSLSLVVPPLSYSAASQLFVGGGKLQPIDDKPLAKDDKTLAKDVKRLAKADKSLAKHDKRLA